MDFVPDEFSPLHWKNGSLHLIDQLKLPTEECWLECTSSSMVAEAIQTMVVRGAPAIGIAAAYGMVLAGAESEGEWRADMEAASRKLADTRPTAVNLFWALEEMRKVAESFSSKGDAMHALEERAIQIHKEDIELCRRMGQHGQELIPDGACVLTHCNAGALATGGLGTALGVIRGTRDAGKTVTVIADETRPFLQGSRLTAWELAKDGFDVTVIPDGAAPFLIARGQVSCAITGADRIAANGDVANKIGTYSVALACARAGVPFYVAAPYSTIDLATASGDEIPIEERASREMFYVGDTRIAPEGVKAKYPAFDVTPAELVTAIISDRGIVRPPYGQGLARLIGVSA